MKASYERRLILELGCDGVDQLRKCLVRMFVGEVVDLPYDFGLFVGEFDGWCDGWFSYGFDCGLKREFGLHAPPFSKWRFRDERWNFGLCGKGRLESPRRKDKTAVMKTTANLSESAGGSR
jgi:hypothetical protein